MKIGYVQNSPMFGSKEQNFEQVLQLLYGAKADLLVLPELFATGYTFVSKGEASKLAETCEGETAGFLMELSKQTGAVVVAGFVEKSEGKVYNSAMIVSAGKVVDTYRKIHLFNREKLWFSPGDKPLPVYTFKGVKIGVMICFDWMFPEAARTLALKGAQVIAHPSNLVMPHCLPAMVTRCKENRVFAVTADRIGREKRGKDDFTFVGGSQITSFNGTILSSAPVDKTQIDIVDIDPHKANNKYINDYNDMLKDRRPEFYE